jgi:hypothetical protein
MNYDHARVWLLAVFSVAAHKEIPYGAEWASKVGGFYGPFTRVEDLPMVAIYRKPVHSLLHHERIKLHPDEKTNRILTGLRHAVTPSMLTYSLAAERACIRDTLAYIDPVLRRTPASGVAEIEALMRAVLKQKDFSLAA